VIKTSYAPVDTQIPQPAYIQTPNYATKIPSHSVHTGTKENDRSRKEGDSWASLPRWLFNPTLLTTEQHPFVHDARIKERSTAATETQLRRLIRIWSQLSIQLTWKASNGSGCLGGWTKGSCLRLYDLWSQNVRWSADELFSLLIRWYRRQADCANERIPVLLSEIYDVSGRCVI
jgi:hypothetical protein